jgi:predicted nuclease with RNAse H fold
VRTIGIDVASQDARTAICAIHWEDGSAEIEPLGTPGASDDQIRRAVEGADRVGVDIPLGWPSAFVEAVSGHHQGEAWTAPTDGEGMSALRLRETDRWVTRQARRPGEARARCHPMSVSTNLIAIPAMRMARVLGPIDRSGRGPVVEVYPAAALFVWGLPYRRYKGAEQSHRATRDALVGSLREAAPWLRAAAADWDVIGANDHVLDAVIASLVARAKACGLCDERYDAASDNARREGWIALPLPDTLPLLGLRPKYASSSM